MSDGRKAGPGKIGLLGSSLRILHLTCHFFPSYLGKVLLLRLYRCCPERCVESLGITLRFCGSAYGSLESWGGVLGVDLSFCQVIQSQVW